MSMLEIKDLHVNVQDKEILKGINLKIEKSKVYAIMGPNGSGKSTLSLVLTGKEGYQITKGSITFEGQDITSLSSEERAWKGIFLSFQYPVSIPGIKNSVFLKTMINTVRKQKGLLELEPVELLNLIKTKAQELKLAPDLLSRSLNDGFSGGEKKRNEILQMCLLEPKLAILDETDSGLDVDALKIVAQGVNQMRSSDRAFVLITHYQRLLDYITPDVVFILSEGKIIKTGDASLAKEVESKGFGWIHPTQSQVVLPAG